MRNSGDLSEEEYLEPVYYCRSCHSLCVVVDEDLADEDWDGSRCGRCNSTDIDVCSFGDWLKEEEKRIATRQEIEWNKL